MRPPPRSRRQRPAPPRMLRSWPGGALRFQPPRRGKKRRGLPRPLPARPRLDRPVLLGLASPRDDQALEQATQIGYGASILEGIKKLVGCGPGQLALGGPAGAGGLDQMTSRAGSKPIRRKTNNKIMATSGGTGRSPLSILQDDNSPGAPAPRQGKRLVLGENIAEKKEVIVDLSRSLKSGNCAWSNLNKENQQSPFVEN